MPVRAKHWETVDGRKFDDRKVATRHERWLELVNLCGVLCDYVVAAAPGSNATDIRERDLATTVLQNARSLQRILRADPCEGGGEE